MLNGRKLIFVILAFATATLLFAGCKSVPVAKPTPADSAAPTASPTPEGSEPVEQPSYERLPLVRQEQNYGSGNALIYPAVDSEEYAALNSAIYKKVLSGIGRMSVPVYTYFSIMCNQDGILSMVLAFYDMDTRELYLKLPVTYDVATGEEIALEDCFIEDGGRWRSVVPDMVAAQAESRGLTLLSDLLPIEDGRPFYITAKSIVIMYRQYEISTYAAGWPEFQLGFDTLLDYIDPACAVSRLISIIPDETEAAEQ